jgi:hypothetical protein
MFVRPEDVDRHFAWSPGRALRLARRGKLPHHVLPDGSIRFRIKDVEAQVERCGFDNSDAQAVMTESEVSE